MKVRLQLGILYLVVLTLVELMGVAAGPALGLGLHAGLILLVMNLAMFRPGLPGTPLWLGLGLVSLLRIASLALPLGLVPRLVWPAVVCLPVWLGIGLYLRRMGILRWDIGLRTADLRWQGLIALSGIPLGVLGSWLLQPQPLFASFNWTGSGLAGLLLVVSVGLTEEVLLRGILLRQAQPVLAGAGLPFVTAVNAILFIGAPSPAWMLGMGLAGLLWGWCVQRSGALWGAALAHGLMLAGMYLVWPYILS